ncbi:unnamed protein product [Symbiodinium sp. KB8]|nr:unnamed protein product [Symbiodinium sp. KB8]
MIRGPAEMTLGRRHSSPGKHRPWAAPVTVWARDLASSSERRRVLQCQQRWEWISPAASPFAAPSTTPGSERRWVLLRQHRAAASPFAAPSTAPGSERWHVRQWQQHRKWKRALTYRPSQCPHTSPTIVQP